MNGIINVYKNYGVSSNTLVNKVKKIVGAEKAGHLGTIDVLGEGVLPITIGKGTKLFNYFLNKDKVYRAIFIFGIETDTLDSEGKIINYKYKNISKENIENVLKKFIGRIKQTPPQFSALKINGKKAYELARQGKTANLKEREVNIYEFKILKIVSDIDKVDLKNRFYKFRNDNELKTFDIEKIFDSEIYEFEINCSSGTYIRSLCKDLASALSTYGTMLKIVRTRCGNFKIEDSYSLDDLKNGKYNIITPYQAVDLQEIQINDGQAKDILDGKNIKLKKIYDKSFKLCYNNIFLGIANNSNDGNVKIETLMMVEK